MTFTRGLIITGGDVDLGYKMGSVYNLIIAVDGGLEAVEKLNLYPDIIIGDFDTISPEILHRYEKDKDIEIIRLNPEKDDTDTQEAVCYAIEQGMKEIDILGGTGSRLDHTIANLFMLKMAYEKGVYVTLYTPLSKIYLIKGEKSFLPQDFFGKYISFIQFDGSAKGVTLEGFKYELDDFDFDTKRTYRLGVSNEHMNTNAKITIREGYVLCIESIEDK